MRSRSTKLALLAGGVWLAASNAALAQAPAAPSATRGFTVPAQDLGAALTRLAQMSGRNILFTPEAVRGAQSTPVRNADSFDSAIHGMLSGTGLVEVVSGGTVIIQRPAPSRPALVKASLVSASLATEAEAAAAGPTVEEVTVTARKSRERLADVPIAITAISGADLVQNEHRRIEDLSTLVPSTNFVITNGHQSSFSIRGLGTNPGNDGLEGSAGVFLDGVYLGRPGMAATDLIDVSQIEVLRGPQGTLFGKNTTAGAVNITTAEPEFTFGGRAQATYGNYNVQQYQGTITGPLIGDALAGRLTAYSTTRDGDVRNVTTGRKVNNLDRWGVRGQLLYKPSDDFSLRVIGEYHREQQSTGAVLTVNSLGVTPAAMQAKLNAVGAVLVPDPSGETTYIGAHDQTGTRQTAFSAEANWNTGGFLLTSLTAYRRWHYASDSDTDATGADVLNGGYNINHDQFSQEFRVKFPTGGPVDAVAGAYYFQQKLHVDSIIDYGPDAAAWLSGIPNSLLPVYAPFSPALQGLLAYNNSHWDLYSTPTTHSYAVFGQATWHVTPVWNVTAGFRETYEKKAETVWRTQPVSLQTGQPIAALASQVVAPFQVSTDKASPSFVVSTDYHLQPNLMVFASVSRGEKAGGVNSSLPAAGEPISSLIVQPETATSYEAGVRGEAFEHRVRYSLDAFYTRVSDYQATFITTVNGQPAQLLANVGRVRTRGVEAEVTAVPIEGLTINANGSYNDAIYASYPNGPCPAGVAATSCDLSGEPVAGAPRWIGNIRVNYEHAVGERIVAYGGAEYSYRSHYYGYLDDSPYSQTGGYGLVNLHAGVRDANGRWDLSVWGKNVTDEHYVSNYLSYGSLLPGVYVPIFGDFATYGATLRTQF
jgi:iron complex outermembrane receptor protein